MTKAQRVTINIMTIAVLNVIFWLSNYYPRHLFERLPGLVLLNFLYFIIYFSVLIIIFEKKKSLFDGSIYNKALPWHERFAVIKLVILMLCQLAFDGISFFAESVLHEKLSAIIKAVLIAVWWFAIYSIISWKKKKTYSKRAFAVVCLIVLLISALGAALVCTVYKDWAYMHSKFEADSEYLAQYIRNTDWINGIIFLVADCIIGGILVGFHSYEKTDKEKARGQIGVLLARIAIIIVAGWMLVALKIWIYPVGSINNTYVSKREADAKYNEDEFFENYQLKDVYRVDENREPVIVYSKHTRYVDYYTTRMLAVHTTEYDPAYSYDMSDNREGYDDPRVIYIPYQFSDYNISGATVQLYANSVICYVEYGVPYAVMLSELDKCGENTLVINACREFLDEGNIALFEYCCDYLLEYDGEFMEQYIERIAKGDFTEAELEVFEVTKIREEFVMDIARNRLDALGN